MTDSYEFALLKYDGTGNLGDEVQSIAARRFLPRMDKFIDRESLGLYYPNDSKTAVIILNGWFGHEPENWPPSKFILPLLIYFHLSSTKGFKSGLYPSDIMLSRPASTYLRKFGPVGARDTYTLDLLTRAGIESYFSGCLTLTIERPAVPKSSDLIVLCDVSRSVVQHVAARTKKKIVAVSHNTNVPEKNEDRFLVAERLLGLYATASCVITTRLHCALPCVAMGTPVLLLNDASDSHRFAGLLDFVAHSTSGQLLNGGFEFDPDNPPENPSRHLPYRAKLIQSVQHFLSSVSDPGPSPGERFTDHDRVMALQFTIRKLINPQSNW